MTKSIPVPNIVNILKKIGMEFPIVRNYTLHSLVRELLKS